MNAGADRWLPCEPDLRAPLRLFCFPHAGAGASAYRPWVDRLAPAGVQVCPVQPPGRENRFGEEPYRRAAPLLDALTPVLAPYLTRPYAVFGHSLGALLAYEMTRAQQRRGGPMPVRLCVSGRIAPDLADPQPPLHDRPEPDLLDALAALGGIPPAVLAEPQLLRLQLPLIRADLAVNECYRHTPGPPLPVPLTAYGGDRDPKAGEAQVRAWQRQTTGPFRARMLPGGHFFVQSAREALLADLAGDLCGAAA